MSQVVDVQLKDILLSNSSFGPAEIDIIADRICNDYSQFPQLREITHELEQQTERTPATSVRLGICQFMLGRYEDALVTLGSADGGALAYFYHCLLYTSPSPRD